MNKLLRLSQLGDVGLIRDIEAHDLPPAAFTDAQNARFYQGYLERVRGSQVFFTPVDSSSSATIQSLYHLPAQNASNLYWVCFSTERVHAYNGSSFQDITNTSGTYAGTVTNRWVGGVLGGIVVATNGVDPPQQWDPGSPTTQMADLSNWPSGWTCDAIRPFLNFLIAMRVTKAGTEFPHLVQWSTPANPGAVPSAWEAATTNEAGSVDLAHTGGYLVDGGGLRDTFVLYKEHSTWGMRFIGGPFVWDIYPILPASGILAPNCWQEFRGKHLVLTDADVIVHDGQQFESVIDSRNRRALFDEMDPDNFTMSYVAHDETRQELWICVPETGATVPTLAWIWNWGTNTWGVRDLPHVPHIEYGLSGITSSNTWAEQSDTWATIELLWGDRGYNPISRSLIGSTYSAGGSIQFLDFEFGNTERGTQNMTCYAIRSGLNLSGDHRLSTVFEVYPLMEGGPVEISIGRQARPNDEVIWESTKTFDPSSQEKLNFRVTGVYHAIRIRSTGNVYWKIRELRVVYRTGGIR